jgi:hypothetical protein
MKQLETTQAAIVSALERKLKELDKVCQSLTYWDGDGYVSYKKGWEKASYQYEKTRKELREESIKMIHNERWRREKTYPKKVYMDEFGNRIKYDQYGNKPQIINLKTGEAV